MSGGRPAPLRLAHVEQRRRGGRGRRPGRAASGTLKRWSSSPPWPALRGRVAPGRQAGRIVVRALAAGYRRPLPRQVARTRRRRGGWAAEELAALVVELSAGARTCCLALGRGRAVGPGRAGRGVPVRGGPCAWDGRRVVGRAHASTWQRRAADGGRPGLPVRGVPPSGSAPPRAVAAALADLTAVGSVRSGRSRTAWPQPWARRGRSSCWSRRRSPAASLQRLREQFGGRAALRLVRRAGGRPPLPPLQPGERSHEPPPPPQHRVRARRRSCWRCWRCRVRRRIRPPAPRRCSGSCRCARPVAPGSGSPPPTSAIVQRARSPGRRRTSWPTPARGGSAVAAVALPAGAPVMDAELGDASAGPGRQGRRAAAGRRRRDPAGDPPDVLPPTST